MFMISLIYKLIILFLSHSFFLVRSNSVSSTSTHLGRPRNHSNASKEYNFLRI
jgi:hypothetical protein